MVRVPLPEAMKTLSVPGATLSVAPEFRETKVTIAVRQQPLRGVMARLAQVFGGEWREIDGSAPPRHEMRRTRAVAEWLQAWQKTRSDAERLARQFQQETVRRFLDEALAALDGDLPRDENGREVAPPDVGSLPLGRLVKSLGAREKQRLVEHIAAISPVRSGGETAPAPPPLLLRFGDLTGEQQQLIRDFVTGGPGKPAPTPLYDRRLQQLPESLVEIGSQGGIGIEVQVHPPLPDHQYGQHAVGASASGKKLEWVLHREIFRQLGRRPTPPGALLGASLTPEGLVEPAAFIQDREVGGRLIQGLPKDPLSFELLLAMADRGGLNLVADYHTRSARLPVPPMGASFHSLATRAAETYERVLRQEGEYLLSRNQYWPDRDEEETPAPYPERWIAAKTAKEGLSLDDWAVMGQLSDAQLDGLSAYSDPPVRLGPEVRLARSKRWVWSLVASLSPQQKQAAASRAGLAVRDLTPRQRVFLIRCAMSDEPVPWDQVRLRVYYWHTPGAEASKSLGGIYLLVPGVSQPIWYLPVPPPLDS
jgi:hypothetical protein